MARNVSRFEAQLDRLADLRRQTASAEGSAEVARALASKSALVAQKAARIAREWQAAELTPELVSAFERFLVSGAATDKGCDAKREILKALCDLECRSPSIFRRGLAYVQMEPSWPDTRVDTAAEVRGLSAIGLAQTGDPDALEEILPLLLDPERGARIGAVRAIGAAGLPGAPLLLRLKALSGDRDAEVVGECFAALLRMGHAHAVAFVADFLDRQPEAVAEAAALALGDSRLETAFDILRDALERRTRARRRTLLLALALLRREPAIEYLLGLVQSGEGPISGDAAAALAVYKDDPKLQARLAVALAAREL